MATADYIDMLESTWSSTSYSFNSEFGHVQKGCRRQGWSPVPFEALPPNAKLIYEPMMRDWESKRIPKSTDEIVPIPEQGDLVLVKEESDWSLLRKPWAGFLKTPFPFDFTISQDGIFVFLLLIPFIAFLNLCSYIIQLCFRIPITLIFLCLILTTSFFQMIVFPFVKIFEFFKSEEFRRTTIHAICAFLEHYIHVFIDDFFKISAGILFLSILYFANLTWLFNPLCSIFETCYFFKICWEASRINWEREFFWEGHPDGFLHAVSHMFNL